MSAGTDREEKKLNSVIIGQRIKDARKSMNLTQKELGYLIYADGKYISRLENGGSLPSLKRLVLLSRVLNRTCDYFIWDIDVMEQYFLLPSLLIASAVLVVWNTRRK